MEREESFRSACESIASSSSSVYDLPHPLEYYGVDDGRPCMEWEEFDSFARSDWESDDTASQISRSNSMASQLDSRIIVAREFPELLILRKKVMCWLRYCKKMRALHNDEMVEAESWMLGTNKVINLKRRNDVLSRMLPWRKPSRQRVEYLKESIMALKNSLPSILSVLDDAGVEFSYREIAIATDNFSQGKVTRRDTYNFYIAYDCQLRGQPATVKKFAELECGFLTEVKVLTRVRHPNVVRLMGYCTTEDSHLLVHEYMENQDLSKHLLNNDSQVTLSWDDRVQIALDTACALDYIHQQCPRLYIHRDIKPKSILLDGSLRAKITDFELTAFTEPGAAEIESDAPIYATFGYVAPEYIVTGKVSRKVDVYAFGIVLYQLISAKIIDIVDGKWTSLRSMFDDVFSDPGEICRLVDPRLGLDYPIDAVYHMAELARACTQEDPKKRPTMGEAAAALRSISTQDLNF